MQHLEHSFEREVFCQEWKWLTEQMDLVSKPPSRSSILPHPMFTAPTVPYVFLLGWFAWWGQSAHAELPGILAKLMSLQELHG